MKKPTPNTADEQLKGLIGLGEFSARKSYYPELLEKIDALERLNRELEQRVHARTAELEQSLEVLRTTQKQLVESEKMASLGSLVAGVAHEINTPLGTSITAISLAQDGLLNLQSDYRQNRLSRSELEETLDTANQAMASALENLARAAGLVKRFKEVAVDQTQGNLRRIAVMTYLQEVVDSLTPQYGDDGVTIVLSGDQTLEMVLDPNSLTQILSHLISNSVEHGFEGRGGKIDISLQRDADSVSLVYRDNGRGIPEAIRSQVFEPFFTTRRNRGNTGLGLHIIYNLVTQQFGGNLMCESHPGNGTCFRLTFPLSTPRTRNIS